MNKKFPTSDNNRECISMCAEPKKVIKHPITGENITNKEAPFCAIDPVYENGKIIVVDQCNLKQNPTEIDPEILMSQQNSELLNPISRFNPRYFLMQYYNINNVNDFYKWLSEHKTSPVLTRTRVIDCFLIGFGNQITILDENFVDAFILLIKQFWIKVIYNKLNSYIGVKDGKCIIVQPEKNELKKMYEHELRSKYIINELMTKNKLFELTNQYTDKVQKDKFSYENYLFFIITGISNNLTNKSVDSSKSKKHKSKK